MNKKKLSIKDRVDLMLQHGVDNPKKWATVHGYEEPTWGTNTSHGWAVEYKKLREHHLEETNFLFDVLRELTDRYNKLDSLYEQSLHELNSDYE